MNLNIHIRTLEAHNFVYGCFGEIKKNILQKKVHHAMPRKILKAGLIITTYHYLICHLDNYDRNIRKK